MPPCCLPEAKWKQFTVTETETLLDLGRIKPGVYVVRLEEKNQVLIKKLVVQQVLTGEIQFYNKIINIFNIYVLLN